MLSKCMLWSLCIPPSYIPLDAICLVCRAAETKGKQSSCLAIDWIDVRRLALVTPNTKVQPSCGYKSVSVRMNSASSPLGVNLCLIKVSKMSLVRNYFLFVSDRTLVLTVWLLSITFKLSSRGGSSRTSHLTPGKKVWIWLTSCSVSFM